MQTQNISSVLNLKKLIFAVLIRVILVYLFLGLILFVPAGTFNFTEAWIYLLTLISLMLFIIIYFFIKDPKVLERRMKIHEREKEQKLYIKLSYVIFTVAFVIPGLDYRYDWSYVPFSVVLIADGVFIVTYILFFLVLKANAFAARTIEVEKEQKVISEGPYSKVRHPMYSVAIIMYLFTPIVLGSWWALLAEMPISFLIIYRLLNEEKVLLRDLPGYEEYMHKVRFRLVPHLW